MLATKVSLIFYDVISRSARRQCCCRWLWRVTVAGLLAAGHHDAVAAGRLAPVGHGLLAAQMRAQLPTAQPAAVATGQRAGPAAGLAAVPEQFGAQAARHLLQVAAPRHHLPHLRAKVSDQRVILEM